MKDSPKTKLVVPGSQVHFIMLSIAYGGADVINRIYQSGKVLSEQEGIVVRIQVKSKNSDKTIPHKLIRNAVLSLWGTLMGTAGLLPEQGLH